jgi:hypothetical protein
LTRKAGRQDIHARKPSKLANIAVQFNSWNSTLENPTRTLIDFAHHCRPVPGLVETDLNAADAGEQSSDCQPFSSRMNLSRR